MTLKEDVTRSGHQLQVAQRIGPALILSIDFSPQKILQFTETKLGNILAAGGGGGGGGRDLTFSHPTWLKAPSVSLH